MSGPHRAGPALLRGLLGGLCWLALCFVGETYDSYRKLKMASAHVRGDPAVEALMREEVLAWVGRVAGIYAGIGLMAGLWLGAVLWAWYPERPERLRWVGAATLCALLATGLPALHQLVLLPGLYEDYWIETELAFALQPAWLEGAALALALGWLGATLWRWRGRPRAELAPRLLAVAALTLPFLLLARHPAPSRAQANEGLNVLIIGVDALRPDRISREGRTPHIDALLAESAVFDSAWTQLARTYSSWMSLLSGAWPATHGVRDDLPPPEKLVPPLPLLPQELSRAGWSTTFLTDDSRFSYMVPATGFQTILQPEVSARNFVVSVRTPRFRALYGLLHSPLGLALQPTAPYNQALSRAYRPERFANRAVQALAEASQADRFFYALHSCVLHEPGERPWPWYRDPALAALPAKERFRYGGSALDLIGEGGQEADLAAAGAQATAIYDAGLPIADALVGQLMEELRSSGLLERTIVVLLSDHGEELWAPDLPYAWPGPNHGFHPYGDGQHRVVLAIRFPDGRHAGRRLDQDVRLMDLAPTLAEALGQPWPGPPEGRSLLPLLEGEPEEPRPIYIETGMSDPAYWPEGHRRYPITRVTERYALDPQRRTIHIRPELEPPVLAAKDRVAQQGRYKLVWLAMEEGPQLQLFDRVADPENRRDLAAELPEQVAALLGLMRPFLAQDGELGPTPLP